MSNQPGKKPLLLIIDDEVALTRSLQIALRDPGYDVAVAHTAEDGLSRANSLRPEVILLDLRLPDSDDLNPLERLIAMLPDSPVYMMSAHGDIKTAVDAVKRGARDFVTKPFDIKALKARLLGHLQVNKSAGRGLVGNSSVMEKLRQELAIIAKSPAKTVLLLGESGTGKTAAATEIHALSVIARKPFVEVNCAALPETLLESELFGVEKGAYTGAHKSRNGLIEAANEGTLFLDEIGELSLAMQAKLLSFLESQRYRPVGSTDEKQANVRVIAATNRSLSDAVDEGGFRADLYYRLNVMPVKLPALSERSEDIPLLLEHFAVSYSMASNPVSFAPEVTEILTGYNWPGNIRELKNLVERLSVLYGGSEVTMAQLPDEYSARIPENQKEAFASKHGESVGEITEHLANEEKRLILGALRESGGHKGNAAKLLNISRHALKRRLQKLGIQP
ncbi:sigma-54 dependent transcriptional regulator [Parasalinivibrio latis]|uniref:sigma-54-dependent transcriptional regulator n=1 Tax=Parasalinivibrio latis TaxID=2952610 RepID=UPI0030E02FBB